MPNFKDYSQAQSMLLPPNPKDWIPKDHICFLINDAVEQLNLSSIEKTYSNTGCSAYSPKMMLKVLFYSYTQGIRSSRKIEMRLHENCVFRYLSANQQPDHGTINLFRKEHLKDIEDIFAQIVILCDTLGMTNLSDISIDGTKCKANASKKRTVDKEGIDRIREKVREALQQAEQIDREEDEKFGKDNRGYNQIPPALADETTRKKEIKRLNKQLEKLNQAKVIIDDKQERAKTKQQKNLKRNSKVNLTDSDANLMPLKENKSYQPAYNAQLATSKQVILGYDLTDNASDTGSLIQMIEKTEKITEQKVEQVKADSGYFSKDNLDKINEREIEAFIPDPDNTRQKREKEQQSNTSKINYTIDDFKYNSDKDEFTCPQGKSLTRDSKVKGGTRYKCINCSLCPVKAECAKGKNRYLQFNAQLEKYKHDMREKLRNKKGKNKYLERLSDVEPVIGNIKSNQNMREFSCRGRSTALTEFGICCVAHNMVKIYNWLKKTNNNLQELQFNTSTSAQAVA